MWGHIELEPEVEAWLRELTPDEFGQAEFAIDHLAAEGVLLGEPRTRQLRGKLRELDSTSTAGQCVLLTTSPADAGSSC